MKSNFIEFETRIIGSTYIGQNFILDPHMRCKALGKPTITYFHNEMDQPIQNKENKCSQCYNKG